MRGEREAKALVLASGCLNGSFAMAVWASATHIKLASIRRVLIGDGAVD